MKDVFYAPSAESDCPIHVSPKILNCTADWITTGKLSKHILDFPIWRENAGETEREREKREDGAKIPPSPSHFENKKKKI